MSYFTEAQSAEAVNARLGADIDPRLARIMRSLVTHLHAFIKDVELTGAECARAIDFLTATGRICSAERQEFILRVSYTHLDVYKRQAPNRSR